MKETTFFETQTKSSWIKANIISEYFPSYCKIITSRNMPRAIRYIDLFSGPGFYGDNNPSTPILVARNCFKEQFLKNNVRFIFNDNMYSNTLKSNFEKEFPDGTFRHKTHFGKSTVGESEEITKFLKDSTMVAKINQYPSLLFIDPFGYKGIETIVLAEFLKNWGNEIFLFVNTKRIHPALENQKFEPLMKDLFPSTLEKIKRDRRYMLSVPERLNLIIDALGNEYQSILGGEVYYTAFKFQEEDSDATSHYILHLTKGKRGYDLIKTTYNDFANIGTIFDGINTYTFDAKKMDQSYDLFDLKSENIDKLKNELFAKFKGKTIDANKLFEDDHINNLYSRSHYTEALRRLVAEEKISAYYTDNKQHTKTVLLSKDCILNFK